MQQQGVKYRETYAPVVNWISVSYLLDISSIHELPSISINFVLAFPQAELDVDVLVDISLVTEVDRNIEE